jgi:hypothetical protein
MVTRLTIDGRAATRFDRVASIIAEPATMESRAREVSGPGLDGITR